jgi:hypothetical protein
MPTTTDTSRTARLLALMKKGDDAFNARDFAATDEVHLPDMIAYITGFADLIYGREAHTEAMKQLLRMFPRHTREQRPLPDPVRQRRLDHRRHQRHRDLHRRDDPAGRHRDPPDRKSGTSSSARPPSGTATSSS